MANIRVSTLPMYCDCPRRAAASLFWKEIKTANYSLPFRKVGAAAAVGTGTHRAAEYMIKTKSETGEPGKLSDATENGILKYKEEIYNGIEFDEITGNNNDAEKQIQVLSRSYYHEILPKKNIDENALSEFELRANSEEFSITGHPDLWTSDRVLSDLKTGRVTDYLAQGGGYSLLLRSEKQPRPEKIVFDFTPRTRPDKTYPGPTIFEYTGALLDTAEETASQVIKMIKRDLNTFLETGEPWSFAANSKSMLCSPKYCRAHGTKFCKLGNFK